MVPHAEGAFYSESGSTILSGRQLTYPKDSPKGNNTYPEDGSTILRQRTVVEEHGFDTEGSGGEGGFNMEDGGGEGGFNTGFNTEGGDGRAVSIRWAVVERTVVQPGSEAICFYASIYTQ